MKIGIAQLNPTIGDLKANAAKILAAAREANAGGANLLLTPELSLCGYPPRDLLMHEGFIADLAIATDYIARSLPHDLAVLIGTAEPNPQAHHLGGKPLFNSAVLLQYGKVQQVFHKRLLPTYDVFDEDRYFEPGETSGFFTLTLPEAGSPLRIGVTICEDIWNDAQFWGKRRYAQDPVADLVDREVDLLVNLSASPYAVGKQKLREAMLRHSAIAHQLPLVYVNQVGANDDLIFDGGSVAFTRQGEVVARACAYKTDLRILEFDSRSQDWNVLSEVVKIEHPPACEEEEIWHALVLGVRDYAAKCGFQRAVIGLSGGVDSALVAAIAADALGSEHVLGVLMPSPYSSDHSIGDALSLARNLGIATETIPIEPMMQAFAGSLASLFAGTKSDITEENLQARIRGNLLMAIANKFGHLLISTGNKSEMAVGYCTLYGDMNGGLSAIADVPKMRVYALCRWFNTQREQGIPEHILTKPPSAELRPDQYDRDSLPDYEILDDILWRYVDRRQGRVEIVAAGHDPAIVDRVMGLVGRAEFKRRQAPPGLKISDRAFGSGWRMPIASRRSQIR